MWYEGDSLNHRDILGSLMGQGIKREMVGDLLVDKHSCDLLVCQSIAPFLQQNLVSAGRTKLSVSEIDLHQLHIPVQEVKKIHDTVATLRLDAVAAAGFSTSRAKRAGFCQLAGHGADGFTGQGGGCDLLPGTGAVQIGGDRRTLPKGTHQYRIGALSVIST